METNVLDERLKFVTDYESGQWSMTELCERYGVTRPTGYKWLARHRASGRAGLADRSRARMCAAPNERRHEALIVEARQEYGWGQEAPAVLRTRHPTRSWPAAVPSTSPRAPDCSERIGAGARGPPGATRCRRPPESSVPPISKAVQDR